MHNKKLIDDMIAQANVCSQDLVLDLGAGKGALTSALYERANRVLAVEYDRKFIDILKRKFGAEKNVKIIHEDILNIHLPKTPFSVVANIPYAITTPIMKMLLSNPSSYFQKGVIVMEKGAAKRFTSSVVKNDYVLAWRMWFDITYVKGISKSNFAPPPRVDSAMITINRKPSPLVPNRDYLKFIGLANYVLKNPQQCIDEALKGVFTPPQIKHVKRVLRIAHDMPVTALSEQQWGELFATMVRHVPKFRWPKAKKHS